jgi:hypothetical protein
MLDSFGRYELDTTWLARALESLPGSYAGSVRTLDAPYGVVGFGEGAWPAEFAHTWIDAAVVSSGTQFVLTGGFDFGEAEAASLIAEASGSKIRRIGVPSGAKPASEHDGLRSYALEEAEENLNDPKTTEEDTDNAADALEEHREHEVDHLVPTSPFSAYHYLQALAYATGRGSSAEAAEVVLADLRDRCRTEVPTDENPAKRLAWQLWTRTPLLMAPRGHTPQIWAWHVHLARMAKSMSVPIERSPLMVVSGGFEARHESGDSLVALFLGGEDESLRLAREVLETRVDEVIPVEAPAAESYASGLGLWYLGAWVAFYLAMLYGIDPKDAVALERLRQT